LRWLVVGLGNPGPEYAVTRHNVGFMVADQLAHDLSVKLARHKRGHALAGEARVGEPGVSGAAHVVIVEPLSFMNESGGPVKAIAAFYDVPPDRMVVVHDELDIPFGDIRVKLGGGDNGHNGLRSIRKALGTGDFYRVRVGIGRPPGRQSPVDFVLKPYTGTERKDLPEVVVRAADAVTTLIVDGLERTQNRFNGSPQQG
jgi:peptidyl-tRNA hydrolase, PTH1 family